MGIRRVLSWPFRALGGALKRAAGKRLFQKLVEVVEMTGWKSKLAGIGLILTAVGCLVAAIVSGQFDDVGGCLTVLFQGLAVLGLAHKLDKLRAFFEFLGVGKK